MTYSITMPLPNSMLSPNARCHWAVKAKHKKSQRLLACALMRAEIGPDFPAWKEATVQIEVTKKTRVKFDSDNFLSSCKAVFDGVQDSGLIEDDCGLTHLPLIKNEPDKNNPHMKITFTKTV